MYGNEIIQTKAIPRSVTKNYRKTNGAAVLSAEDVLIEPKSIYSIAVTVAQENKTYGGLWSWVFEPLNALNSDEVYLPQSVVSVTKEGLMHVGVANHGRKL
jgi:hypothetical protein